MVSTMNTLIQMIRSLSFLDAILVFDIPLGIGIIVFGANMLLRRRQVTQRALDGRREALHASPLLTNMPLDDETLARIIRHGNTVGGVSLLGIGLSLLIGSLCCWFLPAMLALYLPAGAMPLAENLTLAVALAVVLLGAQLSDALQGFIWRKPAGLSLPPVLLRMSFYRPVWFAVLEYATFVVYILAAVLVVSGVVPSTEGLSQQQTLGLAILLLAVFIILVLEPEAALWLTLYWQPWPPGLPPALAIRMVASGVLASTRGTTFAFTNTFLVPFVFFWVSATAFKSIALGCILWLLGATWFIACMLVMIQQKLRSRMTQATFEWALATTVDNQGR